MNQKKYSIDEIAGFIFSSVVFVAILLLIVTTFIGLFKGDDVGTVTSNEPVYTQVTTNSTVDAVITDTSVESSQDSSGKCVDITSYDYNWQNDVKCTRVDGSTFYTDYAGGREFDPDFGG